MPARKKSSNEAITTVAARQNFSDLINRVAYGKDRILLTRRSRPLAAVVPMEDIALLEAMEDRERPEGRPRCDPRRSNARGRLRGQR